MKRLAATAITLMMTAAIGTAAASPYDRYDGRQATAYAYNHAASDRDSRDRHDNDRRWDGHGRDSGWNRYQYHYYGTRYDHDYRGRYRYPAGVSFTYVDEAVPYYPATYAYDDAPYGYYDGYVACDTRVRYDNTGDKLLGAVIGGAIGNTVGKGDGRKASTIAGAVIGYSIAANATHDRRYVEDCGY